MDYIWNKAHIQAVPSHFFIEELSLYGQLKKTGANRR